MSSYNITEYSKKKSRELGVTIKPSTRKGKKIDVYKADKKIASIGDINYLDYPNYIKTKGIEYANIRRDAYRSRHKKDMNVVGSPGFYSSRLLW
jgi:hypothetical protein